MGMYCLLQKCNQKIGMCFLLQKWEIMYRQRNTYKSWIYGLHTLLPHSRKQLQTKNKTEYRVDTS